MTTLRNIRWMVGCTLVSVAFLCRAGSSPPTIYYSGGYPGISSTSLNEVLRYVEEERCRQQGNYRYQSANCKAINVNFPYGPLGLACFGMSYDWRDTWGIDPDQHYSSTGDIACAWIAQTCPDGYALSGNVCLTNSLIDPKKTVGSASCRASPSTLHPISIGGGGKYLKEADSVSGFFNWNRTYNSGNALSQQLTGISNPTAMFGTGWSFEYGQSIQFAIGNASTAWAVRPDGRMYAFTLANGVWGSDADINDQLVELKDSAGARTGWRYWAAIKSRYETYTAFGVLQSVHAADGSVYSLVYADGTDGVASGNGGFILDANGQRTATPIPAGWLLKVIDVAGRQLRFDYDANQLVVRLTDATGNAVQFKYKALDLLDTVVYPDGKAKTYLYGEAAYISNAKQAVALTGVVDENGARYASYWYDAQGRAYDEKLAEFALQNAARSQLTYNANSNNEIQSTAVKDAAGVDRVYNFAPVQGVNRLVNVSQPGGSGCAASTSAQTYDANANITSHDDFSGNRSCSAFDTKNQETTRVEGLSTSVDCATVLPANAALPANARKITTAYHSDWRMPTVINAPGTITTSIYHGQPDPFNGNTVANCTLATNLPNGKPLPLLCKQVTQATLPSGALDVTVANTGALYTYDAAGRVLTVRDSLNRTTSYTYYPDTAFTGTDPTAVGHTVGDLQTITNPAGFVTTFNAYDKAGRILQTTDPKGIVTDMTYTPRGRVNTVTTTAPGQTARTTTYTYDGVGQLTGVANPDGSSLTYTYDAAHRLIGATDTRGNSVAYTLDNMGNRIKEDIKDPTGVLQRSVNRSFDALNRLQQISGAVQ